MESLAKKDDQYRILVFRYGGNEMVGNSEDTHVMDNSDNKIMGDYSNYRSDISSGNDLGDNSVNRTFCITNNFSPELVENIDIDASTHSDSLCDTTTVSDVNSEVDLESP